MFRNQCVMVTYTCCVVLYWQCKQYENVFDLCTRWAYV